MLSFIISISKEGNLVTCCSPLTPLAWCSYPKEETQHSVSLQPQDCIKCNAQFYVSISRAGNRATTCLPLTPSAFRSYPKEERQHSVSLHLQNCIQSKAQFDCLFVVVFCFHFHSRQSCDLLLTFDAFDVPFIS